MHILPLPMQSLILLYMWFYVDKQLCTRTVQQPQHVLTDGPAQRPQIIKGVCRDSDGQG
jgi:hypothetical protein